MARITKANPPGRLSIVGIGSELAGDDAVGLAVVNSLLADQKKGLLSKQVLLINAGPSPENFSGQLRQFKPDLVILIDAAEMILEAGEIWWLNWEETIGLSASSHTLPLSIFSRYLSDELHCQVALLGIQPHQLDLGKPLSPPIHLAKKRIVRCLRNFLSAPESAK